LPSVIGFLKSLHNRLLLVYYAEGKGKLNLLVYTLIDIIPRTVRRSHSFLNKFLLRIQNSALKRTILKVKGVKYSLIDYESAFIITPLFEEWMWRYLRPKRGDIFLDVGAHIGKYTCQVARIVGDEGIVIAIEPSPENYRTLVRNIKLNSLKNVVALNVAGWNKNTNLRLYLAKRAGQNSVKMKVGKNFVSVSARVLDEVLEELGIERVDWVKIDVEGAEYEVLEGLWKALTKYKPKLIIECREENLEKVRNLLSRLGYISIQITGSSPPYIYCVHKSPLKERE